MESPMSSASLHRLPVYGVLAAAVLCAPTGVHGQDGTGMSPDDPSGSAYRTGMFGPSPELAQPTVAGHPGRAQAGPERTGMLPAGTTDPATPVATARSQSTPPAAETPVERAERARSAAEETLRRSVLPQPMSQERFAEFLRGIDASLALNSDLRDAHDTYLTGIEQQRESTARQILRLLPASYRFDAARLSFLPRPTPELVALLSLREKSAKAIAAAERRLLDAVATATPDAHRASFARATLAWRLEQLPAEQLLPSTRLTLVEFVGELRLDAGTAEALASTVGEYATALARALDARTTLLQDAERQRALIETTAGTLWRYAPPETSAAVEAQLAAIDDRAFASEVAIRDIHFDALTRLRARLQPRDGRRLVELLQRALHPELFEDERLLSRMTEETLAHPSFTADQDTALLDALETSFQRLEPLSRAACEAADLILPRLANSGQDAMLAEIDARIAVIDAQTRRRTSIKEAMQRIRGMLGDADPTMTARVDDAIYTIDSLGRADQFEARALALRRNALADSPAPNAPPSPSAATPIDAPQGSAGQTPRSPEEPRDSAAPGGSRDTGGETQPPPTRSGRGSRGSRRSADN